MTSEALAAVAAKFRASLATKADEIERARSEHASGSPASTLAALMHKLAGAAGFYDETAIAKLAADLERTLEVERTGELDREVVERDIDRLVALLRNRADAQ